VFGIRGRLGRCEAMIRIWLIHMDFPHIPGTLVPREGCISNAGRFEKSNLSENNENNGGNIIMFQINYIPLCLVML
jgi:hypothetical protein